MKRVLLRCVGRDVVAHGVGAIQHVQTRRMTDEMASLWLSNLKRPALRGRRDTDPREAQFAAEVLRREMNVLEEEGWELGVQAYTTAIAIVSKYGDIATAEALFTELKEKGVVPNAKIYNSMLFAYNNAPSSSSQVEGRKADNAARFLEILQEMSENVDHSERDEATFLAVLHGLSKRGTHTEVRQAFDMFKAQGVSMSLQMYNVLLSSCPGHTETEPIVAMLHDEGFVPDRYTIGSIFKACAREADTTSARATMVRYGPEVDISVNEWTGYLTVFKQAGRYDEAVKVWEDLVKQITPSAVSYGVMVRICVNHIHNVGSGGDVDDAVERAHALFQAALDASAVVSPVIITTMMELCKLRKDAAYAKKLRGISKGLNLPLAGVSKRYYVEATGERIE